MKTAEIREAFQQYFTSKQHTAVSSSSLIPAGDPTLLFVNAGMVQFKDCFLGLEKRNYSRATTCQKCLRISGKHNDLENVGRTARHHTFFEMLGNFSFGDYFKKDAIIYGWEFLTEVMALDQSRLWVTVFENDDEAAELWAKCTSVQPERILRFGEADNFWAMGDTGPCGPCSEIHYYIGDKPETQSEANFRANEHGHYLEIWNLVFMQFNRSVNGELTPLPKPSVDTGMGLERIAAIKQGVRANYDADLLRSLIRCTEKLSSKNYLGVDYTPRSLESDRQYAIDVAMRVAADHSRACAFLVADGISPGSEGRGYVLRRLVRRACRHGRALGFKEPFLYKVTEEVVHQMGLVYPELQAARDRISKVIRAEEERFLVTLETGMSILNREMDQVLAAGGRTLSGKVAFTLHDTYGFPLDLTEDLARTRELAVDAAGFESEMDQQRERSRADREGDTTLLIRKYVTPRTSRFVGYTQATYESQIEGLFTPEGAVSIARSGETVALVAEETPFYAESGGQVGDKGTISTNNASLEVFDTQKAAGDTIVHFCRVMEGDVAVGERGRFAIAEASRRRTRAHHSSTHLLHQALREVLGEHVHQAGSRVSDRSLRFDFRHYESLSDEQLEAIESRMNAIVIENHPVLTETLPIEEAKARGAMALFGEKYGDNVRVIRIGPGSLELCGGTHVDRSGDIGFVTILGESAIAAGVRRIEAVSGRSAFEHYATQKRLLRQISRSLSGSEKELADRVDRLAEANRELEKKLAQLAQQAALQQGNSLIAHIHKNSRGHNILAQELEGLDAQQLREMSDNLRARSHSLCLALGSKVQGKAILLVAVSPDLIGQYHAGEVMKKVAQAMGCRGGGKAELAQAGGGDPAKLGDALALFRELVA